MRRIPFFLIVPVLFLYGSPSRADGSRLGVIVLGMGPGHDCYIATETPSGRLNNRAALDICNQAVDDYAVSVHDRAAAHINRGFVELRIGDYASALADSEEGIALMPSLAQGYLDRGAALIGLERYAEAIPAIDKSIEIGFGMEQIAYFDRGLAKENLHDIQGAYYDYRKAAEIDPGFQPAADQLKRFTVVASPATK